MLYRWHGAAIEPGSNLRGKRFKAIPALAHGLLLERVASAGREARLGWPVKLQPIPIRVPHVELARAPGGVEDFGHVEWFAAGAELCVQGVHLAHGESVHGLVACAARGVIPLNMQLDSIADHRRVPRLRRRILPRGLEAERCVEPDGPGDIARAKNRVDRSEPGPGCGGVHLLSLDARRSRLGCRSIAHPLRMCGASFALSLPPSTRGLPLAAAAMGRVHLPRA